MRRRPQQIDLVLAGGLFAWAQLQIWLTTDGRLVVVVAVLSAWLCAALALRRRYPFAAGVGGNTAMTLAFWFGLNTQIFGTSIAWFCVIYGLTVWTPRRQFIVGVVCVAVGDIVPFTGSYKHASNSILFGVITVGVMLLIRNVLGDRERRVELAERERDLAAREAVVEERARIARELHDAIAHNVSMMVVQAGAERRVLDESHSSTRAVLETVEQIGRGALTEMRRLVGMLRSDDDDPLTPQPGLGDLHTLVTQVREAGLPVDLEIEGVRRDLPVGLELSAYRIVQEALTNALKHAGDARASVRVRYGPESLELEIVDDGHGSAARAAGGGHGLVGMRERVALYGGRFEAARRPAGGFTVRALLPIR